MSPSLRNSLLVCLALAAGMFAQEVVGKLLAASESQELLNGPGTPTWNTAEQFYNHHQLSFETPASETSEATQLVTAVGDTASESPATEATEPVATELAAAAPPADVVASDQSAAPVVSVEAPSATSPAENVSPDEAVATMPAEPPPAPAVAESRVAESRTAERSAATVRESEAADVPPAPARVDVLPAPESGAQRGGPSQASSDTGASRRPAAAVAQESSQPPLTRPPTAADYPSDPGSPTEAESDVKRVLRERAALKASERAKRIEVWKWFRYAPLRPPAHPVPMMGGAETPVLYLR